ncbi:MAG TPA: enoyl-CoA hydratase/isomerase family protein [Pyrinomonadaceae bacterium]|nr:enoyl-CoA hydratase/isomerase family protein [Pyrinomonadaceae bacterium]
MTDSPAVVAEINDATAIVRLAKPAQRNPLSRSTLHELHNTLAQLLPRADLRAVVFTGTDDAFASGADIRELSQLNSTSALEFSQLGQGLFKIISEAQQLTIAAINGFCMGGGLDFALACDIRIASSNAVFAHPGAKLGIITGWGGTQRLPRTIGRARALEFLITARQCSSSEALRMGLISEISDPVIAAALQIAERSTKNVSPS